MSNLTYLRGLTPARLQHRPAWMEFEKKQERRTRVAELLDGMVKRLRSFSIVWKLTVTEESFVNVLQCYLRRVTSR